MLVVVEWPGLFVRDVRTFGPGIEPPAPSCVASLSEKNMVLSIEASLNMLEDFKKNLSLNEFKNIKFKNLAISDQNNQLVKLNESINDWESSIIHSEFKKKNFYSGKKIAFGVDSFEDYKIWYEENFIELANKFYNEKVFDYIYLVCGKDKQHIAKDIIAKSNKNYFIDFYISLDSSVQEKIEYVFKVIKTVDLIPQKFLKSLAFLHSLNSYLPFLYINSLLYQMSEGISTSHTIKTAHISERFVLILVFFTI